MFRFITLEGGEGAGKSTLIKNLESDLKGRGFDVLVTREPGGSFLGEEIRELLLNQKRGELMSPMAELLLFLAARAQHINTLIEPALKEGKIVICDRFTDSTIAYQAAARGLDESVVKNLCSIAQENIAPSLTLYLDIDPKIGIKRASGRNGRASKGNDRIEQESMAFHERVRDGFLSIARENKERVHIIDTSKTKEVVFEKAKEIVEHWLQHLTV